MNPNKATQKKYGRRIKAYLEEESYGSGTVIFKKKFEWERPRYLAKQMVVFFLKNQVCTTADLIAWAADYNFDDRPFLMKLLDALEKLREGDEDEDSIP